MKKFLTVVAIMFTLFAFSSCTENTRTRNFGGAKTITLAPGEKLVQVTWKDASLWILTEPMEPDYKPKTKKFREDSRFGVMEGTVIIQEVR